MAATAKIVKRKGNDAFAGGDFAVAVSLYTHAMAIDPSSGVYALNRCAAHLKLRQWEDAENDATLALQMCHRSRERQKALFRRCQAQREQYKFPAARADLQTFLVAGGTEEEAEEEKLKLDQAEKNFTTGAMLNPASSPIGPASPKAPTAYEIKGSHLKGQGAFATRELHRGDLILAEKPMFRVSEGSSYVEVGIAVQNLSPNHLNSFLSLKNSHPEYPHFAGINRTNAFATGVLCLDASRFNHSCAPNARYSWHEESGCQRIFALCDIAKDEEICVSYLAGRGCYATARAVRRERLSKVNGFECCCLLCSKDAESTASDDRRKQISAIWDGMMQQSNTAQILRDVVRAIRLMREDGYYADADDFATDAAAICAGHSDWKSSKYWAHFMYDVRMAEFGEDHDHTKHAKEICQNPKDRRWHKQAGMLRPQSFHTIRL